MEISSFSISLAFWSALFVAATISYNVIEAVVALSEGARVSSTALIGFGLDSVIEVSSAVAVAWQFASPNPEDRERVALRIIAFSFFGLAVYVTVDAVRSLLGVGEMIVDRLPVQRLLSGVLAHEQCSGGAFAAARSARTCPI